MISSFWLFAMPGPTELIIIFFILLLLFGAKRLPEIAKSLGQTVRDFKKSFTVDSDDKDTKKESEA